MKLKTHRLTLDGRTFIGRLREGTPGFLVESVTLDGAVIYTAHFPASNLGTADRDEYLRVMTHTAACKA